MSNPTKPSLIGRVSHFTFLVAGFSCFGLALVYFYLEDKYTAFSIFDHVNILNTGISDDVPPVLAATGAAFLAIWAVIYTVHRADHRAHEDWIRNRLDEFEGWRSTTNGVLIANNRRLTEFVYYWIPPGASTYPQLLGWGPATLAREFLGAYRRAYPGRTIQLPRTILELSQMMADKQSAFRPLSAIAQRHRSLALEVNAQPISDSIVQSWVAELTNALAPVEDAIGRTVDKSRRVDTPEGDQNSFAMLDVLSELRWIRLAYLSGTNESGVEQWIWLNLVATGSVTSAHMRRRGMTDQQSWLLGLLHFFEIPVEDLGPEAQVTFADSVVGDALWIGLVSGYRRKKAMIDAFSQPVQSENFGGNERLAQLALTGDVAQMRRLIGQLAAEGFLEGYTVFGPPVYNLASFLGWKQPDEVLTGR